MERKMMLGLKQRAETAGYAATETGMETTAGTSAPRKRPLRREGDRVATQRRTR
jgi:hypothetical protein